VYGRVGKRSYLHTHAPGKVILATLQGDDVDEIIEYHGLPTYTSETITDPDRLREELDTISEQGYAISDGEAALGVRSVGVAFEGPFGCTHGLGVFGYSHAINAALEQDIPGVLQDAADDVTAAATADGGRQ
jgi:DNA-binding IclR family transcriptional regulator